MNRKESNGKRLLCTSRMLTAIIVLSVFIAGIGILPASAQVSSVNRYLPDSVQPSERFTVTLTQTGFLEPLNVGVVTETLPEDFEYVEGSYVGGAPEQVTYDPATRTLKVPFKEDYAITYDVKASSYEQTAVFSGTYRALVGDPFFEDGTVGGETEVVVGDTTPPVISNVASSSITTNSATITWDTDEPSDSLVKYGTTSGVYTDEESDAADVTSHSIGLAGLDADTTYYFVVNSTDPSGNPAESGENSFTTEAEEKPDLIVTGITPNCDYLFANESNSINATIKNNGTADAGAFNVSFDVDGFSDEVRVISGLAMGASEEVTVMDATLRNAGESVTINVTADCDAEVGESNEANNAMNISKTVVNNGYKGKRYTGGEDIATLQTHTLNGSVLYSVGDSYYLSGSTNPWYTYTANWTASDLPVPGEASIEKARLYVMYTWDKVQGMPDNVSLKFNDNLTTRDAFYTDRKGYDGYDYPYGMLAYDVTGDFNTGSINTAVLENLNPVAGNPSIRGMLLVVIYADDSEPQRTIIMNEGFDLLYGGSGKCTTPEEATAFAPFAGAIEDIDNKSARLITVAPGADPNEGELIFNGNVWTDVWNFAGNSEIGIDDRDVTSYLLAENNEAAFQSSGDYMEASNAILVVAKISPEAPIVTNANATPSIIPDDTDNIPLPEATDPNCWNWTFTGKRWETSQLNVTVTDESNIVSVKINLSSLGGDAEQEITNIPGTNVWTVITNASNSTAGWNGTAYVPYQLQVNATNEYGKSNTSVSIELTVMKNGDIEKDGDVDFDDGLYLVRHTLNVPGYKEELPVPDTIADVDGDGDVDFDDGLYLVRHTLNVPGYKEGLH